jgi:beta-lactamase class A
MRRFALLIVIALLLASVVVTASPASTLARAQSTVIPAATRIANARSGYVGVAAYSLNSGASYGFQSTRAFAMYSTVKVPILLTVLDRAVRQQRRVSAWEQAKISSMIRVSDNNAASALLANVGGARAVQSYLRRIGINQTYINPYHWGLSTTTAQDMARLMAKLGTCSILEPRLCTYALSMMRSVVSSQRWGISAGVPAGSSVAIKNGWYPASSGWGINSIGFVTNGHKRYAIAIYTSNDPSMGYGIQTIQQIASRIYPALP